MRKWYSKSTWHTNNLLFTIYLSYKNESPEKAFAETVKQCKKHFELAGLSEAQIRGKLIYAKSYRKINKNSRQKKKVGKTTNLSNLSNNDGDGCGITIALIIIMLLLTRCLN